MGADLIGYLAFGPARLDDSEEMTKQAAQKVRDLCEFVQKADQYLDEDEDRLRELLFQNPWGVGDEDDLRDRYWTAEYRERPEQLVEELFEIWNGEARDVMFRNDPADSTRRVVGAGELSWGDEPTGYGYQTLKRADQAGLFDLFGIG